MFCLYLLSLKKVFGSISLCETTHFDLFIHCAHFSCCFRQFFGSGNTTETVYSTTSKDCSLNLNSKRHHRPQACKQVNALKLVMNCLNFLSEQIFGSFSQHPPTYHLAIKHQKKIPFTCLNLEPWNYHPQERLQVVYMCSSLLQLAPGSRDLSQAEKKITVVTS